MAQPLDRARSRRWKRVTIMGAVVVALALPVVGLSAARLWKFDGARATPQPDIYYLIFDRYANEGVLSDVYGLDNGGFLDELERRGFYVARESYANYPMTAPSLVSSLNMDYLDIDLLESEAADEADWTPVYERLAGNSAVEDFVHEHGYRFIQIGSWWPPTATSSTADVVVRWDAQDDFLALVEQSTGETRIPRTGTDLQPLGFNAKHRQHALFQFDVLSALPSTGGPNFVLCHFLLPHDPYVFHANGDYVDHGEWLRLGRADAYVEQVRYTNTRILELVDTLLARSGTPPIILIQADEGPYPERFAHGGPLNEKFPLIEATPEELREKFSILNAFYLPGIDPQGTGLHPRITPVNSFRVVLNAYFGTNLALLPARHFILRDREHIYDVSDVTDVLE